MKLEKGYWTDKNGNKWNAKKYSKEEAEKCSSSLIHCFGCVDSYNCEDCSKCENCVYCMSCYKCIFCEYCENCKRCNSCVFFKKGTCLTNKSMIKKCINLTKKKKLILQNCENTKKKEE